VSFIFTAFWRRWGLRKLQIPLSVFHLELYMGILLDEHFVHFIEVILVFVHGHSIDVFEKPVLLVHVVHHGLVGNVVQSLQRSFPG
jgi:hypothetical protein